MIAVTGASGHLGKLVIQSLLKKTKSSEIVAIVRDPSKVDDLKSLGVTIRKGDYDKPETWSDALKGVKKLLLISANVVGSRVKQHKTVINAAKEAKVEILAYTSILRADSSKLLLAQEHVETENAIKESGVPYIFLRNSWYFENDTGSLKHAIQNGAILNVTGDGKLSSASRADYAEAAAVVLTTPVKTNAIYELGGDQPFTMSELAVEASKQSGKTVSYKKLSADDYKKFLVQVGLPDGFAGILVDSYVEADKGGLYTNSKDLSQLIGRPTTTLAEAVKNALK